jgi:organic radical activating enzyme
VIKFIAPTPGGEQPPRISICGGEPLLQEDFLFRVLFALRTACLECDLPIPTVLLYTGYPLTYLCDGEYGDHQPIAEMVDMVVTGPYIQSVKCLDTEVPTDFVGSDNQEFTLLVSGSPVYTLGGQEANEAVRVYAEAIDETARMFRDLSTR